MTATISSDVAIIIPCYNDGSTLPETVQSALAQQPREIIVVDDGSTDPQTLRVLETLRGQDGINVLRKDNAGLSAARMTAVYATECPLIVPIDADDLIEAGALARLVDALDKDPTAAVAFGDQINFGITSGYRRGGRGWDAWLITHVNANSGGAVVIRRDLLLQAGGWVLVNGYEDWDLWMALLELGHRSVYVPGPAHHYRQRENRMLSSSKMIHSDLFSQMVRRHPNLFANRRRNWLRSSAPLRCRLGIPLVHVVPGLGAPTRHRLSLFLMEPGHGGRSQVRKGLRLCKILSEGLSARYKSRQELPRAGG